MLRQQVVVWVLYIILANGSFIKGKELIFMLRGIEMTMAARCVLHHLRFCFPPGSRSKYLEQESRNSLI